jgi:DNA polymerase III epsilon subunit-like protein
MIIAIDTETTHYDPTHARIIEVGAVCEDGDTFEALCNPGFCDEDDLKPWRQAMEINGISEEEVLSAYPHETIAEDFRIWVSKQEQKLDGEERLELAGYNSWNYDSKLLERFPWQITRSKVLWVYDVMIQAMGPMGEAGALARHPYYGFYKWPKLTEAERFFGIQREGKAHRALSDARATLDILQILLSEVKD